MPLFKRRKKPDHPSSPADEQAITDLARHAGVSMEEARRSAEGMSAEEIAEFIQLEQLAETESDRPDQPT